MQQLNAGKFAQQLEFHQVSNWRPYYVEYVHILTLILRLHKRYHLELHRGAHPLPPSSPESGIVREGDTDEEGSPLVGIEEGSRYSVIYEMENEIIKLLRSELNKAQGFFIQKVHAFEVRLGHLAEEAERLAAMKENEAESKPVVIRKADKVLERSLVQMYRQLMMLDNFAQLNYAALTKLLNKHDKKTPFHQKDKFDVLLDASALNKRPLLTQLIARNEALYAETFSEGSMSRAKAKLWRRQHDDWDWDALHIGIFVGMAVPLVAFLLLFLIGGKVDTVEETIDRSQYVLPIYRFFGIITLACWLWGMNVLVWHKSRINHSYIFGFDPSSTLGFHRIFKISGFLTVLWLLSFVSYIGDSGSHFELGIPVETWPLALCIAFAAMFFCPFNMFHRSSRLVLMKTLLSVVVSPFGRVTFLDFYVGDVLTSLVKSVVDFQYTVCFYVTGDFIDSQPNQCIIPNKVLPPILSFMPLFWRMMQCLRIFIDTKRIHHVWQWKHMANALKYLVGFGVILFSSLHENLYSISYSDPHAAWDITRIMWVVFFVISTLYTFSWDFFMDWGFGQWSSKNYPLRNELFYTRHRWFYYYVIISNFFFRFFWTLTISKAVPVETHISSSLLGWIAATVEIVRRFTWSLIRIENEYLGTSDTIFRDSDFIPLPFGVNKVSRPQKHMTLESSESLTDLDPAFSAKASWRYNDHNSVESSILDTTPDYPSEEESSHAIWTDTTVRTRTGWTNDLSEGARPLDSLPLPQ